MKLLVMKFLHLPVTSTLFDPNILFSTLFSKTFSLLSLTEVLIVSLMVSQALLMFVGTHTQELHRRAELGVHFIQAQLPSER
jgi:hypothetical protein